MGRLRWQNMDLFHDEPSIRHVGEKIMVELSKILSQSAAMHSHLCPRQVLGARMGLYAGKILSLELPQTNKRLHTFVETDGCAADGISFATGCWLGRRTLHALDFGKIAATFVDSLTGQAVRIYPHPDCRKDAPQYAPEARNTYQAQLESYQVMPDDRLFVARNVKLSVSLEALISRKGARAFCQRCGEEIMNEREVFQDGEILCRSCAGEAYYLLDEPVFQVGAFAGYLT
jgi:formylmethanofuran dehydrogenase subunit E